jgi:hypothetical protein
LIKKVPVFYGTPNSLLFSRQHSTSCFYQAWRWDGKENLKTSYSYNIMSCHNPKKLQQHATSSQMNAVHILPSYLFKITIDIVLNAMLMCMKWSHFSRFPHQNPENFSLTAWVPNRDNLSIKQHKGWCRNKHRKSDYRLGNKITYNKSWYNEARMKVKVQVLCNILPCQLLLEYLILTMEALRYSEMLVIIY